MRILFAVFFAVLSAVLLLGAGSILYVALASVLGTHLGVVATGVLVAAIFQRFWPARA